MMNRNPKSDKENSRNGLNAFNNDKKCKHGKQKAKSSVTDHGTPNISYRNLLAFEDTDVIEESEKLSIVNDMRIKEEPNDLGGDLLSLYEDHEIKEDMVIGPVMLLSEPKNKENLDIPALSAKIKKELSDNSDTENEKTDREDDLEYNTRTQKTDISDDCYGGGRDGKKLRKSTKQYDCDKCTKSFSTHSDLKAHESKHKVTHKCGVCDETFNNAHRLKAHKASCGRRDKSEKHLAEDSRNPFACDICNKSFTVKGNLYRHKQLHSDTTYKCDVCNKSFKQKSYLADHKLTHLPRVNTRHTCVCGKSYNNKSNFNRHKRVFCARRPNADTSVRFRCDVCGKLATEVSLRLHMLKHHSIQPSNQCQYCDKVFNEKRELVNHEWIHTGIKPHKCNICNKKFTRKSILNSHVLTHGVKTYHCDKCDARFYRNYQLTNHKKSHDEISEAPQFPCHICEKKFKYKCNMKQHTKYCSETIFSKPFSCDVCKKRFPNKSEITHHIVNSHLNAFTCDYCKKDFGKKKYLRKHMKIHIENNPFTCDICKKKFNIKGSLKDHLLSHSGVRNYSCASCGKTFIYRSNLSQHKNNCDKILAKKTLSLNK